MFQNKFLFKSFFVLSLLAITPVLVLAQNNPLPSGVSPPPKDIPSESSQADFILSTPTEDSNIVPPEPYPGTAKCFDYYRFQSVQVTAASEKEIYTAGDEVLFRGEVTNENKYPVVDGYVFVRVGRVNSNFTTEGHNITDEFFAVEQRTLDAGAVAPIEFKWSVPKGAAPGEYIANYFFTVGKRFNLGGLPFSNEVIIGSARFQVENSEAGGIMFDRSGTIFDGKKYFHIGDWPRINEGKSVVITQPIKNLNKVEKEIKVTYELYFWDSLRPEDKVSESSETIRLAPGTLKTLQYDIPKMDTSVYYLKIKATTDTDSAIVNIRLASEQARPRINYPAITKFPILNGEPFAIFSCFHNTSGINAEGNISVLLTDKNDNKVGEALYSGVIPSIMLAVASELVAKNTYDYLKLHAEIKNASGVVIDSYDSVYDCATLKSLACDDIASKSFARKVLIFIGLILVVVTAIVSIIIIRVKKKKNQISF
ncbi:MAG: hypothetical protein Q8L47_04330 [bacterium]|nr:hypothetical protein [bacterium]